MGDIHLENTVKTAVTITDTNYYRKLLAKGNFDAIYQDLQKKGFDSAYWAINEFNKGTVYGASNAIYWRSQTGRELDNKTAQILYATKAKFIVEALENRIETHGSVTTDLNYEEYTGANHKANKAHGFNEIKTIHDIPYEINAALYGKSHADKHFAQSINLNIPDFTETIAKQDAINAAVIKGQIESSKSNPGSTFGIGVLHFGVPPSWILNKETLEQEHITKIMKQNIDELSNLSQILQDHDKKIEHAKWLVELSQQALDYQISSFNNSKIQVANSFFKESSLAILRDTLEKNQQNFRG